MTNVIDLDAHRPHVTVAVRCRECSTDWIAVCPTETDVTKLECLNCGARDTQLLDTDIA